MIACIEYSQTKNSHFVKLFIFDEPFLLIVSLLKPFPDLSLPRGEQFFAFQFSALLSFATDPELSLNCATFHLFPLQSEPSLPAASFECCSSCSQQAARNPAARSAETASPHRRLAARPRATAWSSRQSRMAPRIYCPIVGFSIFRNSLPSP